MADGGSQLSLPIAKELVVDLFAGGGGASLGIERAYRSPDVAVNHNPIAIAVHQANHPDTLHYTCDVFEVDPLEATQGRPVGVLWASPDCRHHSKAKGGKPRSKKIRALAWVVIRWAAVCKPRGATRTQAYRHEMTDADHAELLAAVQGLRGLVMLCGYASELYTDTLRGWLRLDKATRAASVQSGSAPRVESMWLNPAAAEAQQQGRLIA